jgi:hypothetical protein
VTSNNLATISIIVAIFTGLAGVYYLGRSAAREAARAKEEEKREAIAAAVKPVQDALDAANRLINRRDITLAARDARIDQLEDELRRGRGHGDDNAARQ